MAMPGAGREQRRTGPAIAGATSRRPAHRTWKADDVGDRSVGKVVAFVTRWGSTGPELLVFDHPMAGVQVPAGTLNDGEDPLCGARREAWEETGLKDLSLVEALGQQVESRAGDAVGRLAGPVEIAGRLFGRGYAASVLDRRPGELRVDVAGQVGWVPTAAFAEDVVRHFFHFTSAVETPEEWWVITPDGDGLCWRCRWAALPDVQLVAGQQEWLDAVRERLSSVALRQPAPQARVGIDPRHLNGTTFELFWAPPFGGGWTLRSWLGPEEIESSDAAGRALGVCFTVDGRVLLVSGNGRTLWNFPGGGREPGEPIESTLCREVYEEACAHVLESTLLGYDRFVEIDGLGNVINVNHQARFVARVALEPFVAHHETAARTLVRLDDVTAMLSTWQPESLRRLLDLAEAATTDPRWLIELSTARSGLVLRELTTTDAKDYYALVDANRRHLTRRGDYAGMATTTFEQVFESLCHPTTDNTRLGVWLEGVLIGRVDLNPINPPNYVLGVWLGEAATGHGYATDACRTAIDFARSRLGATDMWAGITHGNEPSVALFGRLGFERVAELEHHSRFHLALIEGA